MTFELPEGATPIDQDERQGLIPSHILTQQELNAFEQLNITQALPWALKQKDILTVKFLKRLHKTMFRNTWQWAGQFRKTQKNIGVEAYRIETELHLLCEDCQFQIENHSYGKDEIALRFHHRLVFIHAFPNGNGRHARLAADLLIKFLGKEDFSWGSHTYNHNDLTRLNAMRKAYIHALRKADRHDYEELMVFARS